MTRSIAIVAVTATAAIITLVYIAQDMRRTFRQEVRVGLKRIEGVKPGMLSEADILHLPPAVQRYLRYAGVIGKEKVLGFRVEFVGGIRSNPNDPYMAFESVQYNFTDRPTRVFYITAWKMGVPAVGLHLYKQETAIMLIKLLGLLPVADARGWEMNQGETVTLFNDMCFMAPATLIDKNIQWAVVDPLTVRAKFTNGAISITATLLFNERGELVNFISNDRFDTRDGKSYMNYTWETPIIDGYQDINGYRLAKGAKAIYKRPDGDFCYGEFKVKSIEYNCMQ
jgi:hypothetical protein